MSEELFVLLGEGATAFWTYAPAALTPPQWRPLAYGRRHRLRVFTGGLRMSFGGHFLTDVLFSGTVSFLVIWLAYASIYRWPSTPADRLRHRRLADALRLDRLSLAAEEARPRCRGFAAHQAGTDGPGAGRGVRPAVLAGSENGHYWRASHCRQSFYRKPI